MAKEGDIKRVELNVSVHCCDGCKKKVKKILRSTEGVLNVEIDTVEPKVTILGNVEPQKLIKKLLKVGKQAEIWSYNNQNATKENQESRMSPSIKSDTENIASAREQKNHSETLQATSTDTHTESPVSKEGAGNKGLDHKDVASNGTSGMVRSENPLLYQPQASGVLIHPSITTHDGACKVISTDTFTQQYYYMVEPARGPVILPYCAVYPYNATPVYSRGPEVYNYGQIMPEPPVQAPTSTTVLGDYFNDENTVGCQIMSLKSEFQNQKIKERKTSYTSVSQSSNSMTWNQLNDGQNLQPMYPVLPVNVSISRVQPIMPKSSQYEHVQRKECLYSGTIRSLLCNKNFIISKCKYDSGKVL